MSLYRAYFVPWATDPSGMKCGLNVHSNPLTKYWGGLFSVPTPIPSIDFNTEGWASLQGTVTTSRCKKCCPDGREVFDDEVRISAKGEVSVAVTLGKVVDFT